MKGNREENREENGEENGRNGRSRRNTLQILHGENYVLFEIK